MLRGWDWPLLAAVLLFSAKPVGPACVLAVASSLFYCYRGKPRVHVYPLLWTAVIFGLWGIWYQGLSRSYLWRGTFLVVTAETALRVSAVFSAFMAFLLEHLVPHDARLPKPTGPYAVIQASVHLNSHKRGTETMVRVYYPTADKPEDLNLPEADYLFNGIETCKGFGTLMAMPQCLFSFVRYCHSLTYSGDFTPNPLPRPADKLSSQATFGASVTSKLRKGRLPVLVFSHGLGGVPEIYSATIADLVSHGIVVLAPEHCDSSAAYAALPFGSQDASRNSSNDAAAAGGGSNGAADDAHQTLSAMAAGRIKKYVRLTKEQIDDLPLAHKLRHGQLQQRTREAQAVIDLADWLSTQKERKNGDANADNDNDEDENERDGGGWFDKNYSVLELREVLGGRVDTGIGVAVAGHSFGAATAISCADKDIRVKSVVALDPWLFPLSSSTLQKGIRHAPSMALLGDYFSSWHANNNALKLLLSRRFRSMHTAADEADLLRAMEAWDRSTSSSIFGLRDRDRAAKKVLESARKKGYGNSMTRGSFTPSNASSAKTSPSAASATGYSKQSAQQQQYEDEEEEDDKPSISIFHCNGVDPRDGAIHPVFKAAPHSHPHEGNLLLTLKGTEHQNYCDFAVFAGKPVRWIGATGSMDAVKSMEAIRLLSRAFVAVNLLQAAPSTTTTSTSSSTTSKPAQEELLRSIKLEPQDANASAIRLLVESGHEWTLQHLCPAAWTAQDAEEGAAAAASASSASLTSAGSSESVNAGGAAGPASVGSGGGIGSGAGGGGGSRSSSAAALHPSLSRSSSLSFSSAVSRDSKGGHSQQHNGHQPLASPRTREDDARAAAADRNVSREKRAAEIAAANADR